MEGGSEAAPRCDVLRIRGWAMLLNGIGGRVFVVAAWIEMMREMFSETG
jgi:hypothetical protein